MKYLIAILVILLLLLQYRLWFAEGGMRDVSRLERALEVQRQENNELRLRNEELRAEVIDLKKGLEAIEERARSELGMVKEGETFIQIVEVPEGSSQEPDK